MNGLKFILIFFLGIVSPLFSWEKSGYKIVIDPGHGGNNREPFELFGDKYDTISGKFLESYRPGAVYKERTEREIVLSLAKELKAVLDLTHTTKGFRKFKTIASKYTKTNILPIRFSSVLTREDDYSYHRWKEGDDINYNYRMYDFLDKKTGKKVLGRISKINQEEPYLIVSLHLNPSYPGHPGGMAAVIAPPYRTFQTLRLISKNKLDESEFQKSPYRNWTKFVGNWNHLENAMTDTWIYFHGYWANQKGNETDRERFSGYRQNMVTWKYADVAGWEELAKVGGRGQYSKTHRDFYARGKFWNRERGQGERWRRAKGPEGYGGDNLYASQELLRFVQYGVFTRLRENAKQPNLGPIQSPYISTYSLPTYTNAICAFLEIGFIDNENDMKYIQGHSRLVAESLAVGIYSLFKGLEPTLQKNIPYTPKGKKLGFEKYERLDGNNYFKIVND